ncbi:MAG TPA: hypothetical protein VKY89_12110 [Thermoanaerobaculia bacterium]|nr:hypothetical protein [Thermoanaerobaculia bacterium]
MRRLPLLILALAFLCSSAAFAQPTISYVLIPSQVPGAGATKVELVRTDLTLTAVQATYVGPGESGVGGGTSTTLQAYVGPSTSKPNPLLNLTPVLPGEGGGMMILAPVAGLNTVEVSFEVEQAPVKTAWKLPLLGEADFFPAKSTIFVLNLVKASDAASNLQIFNVGATAATCTVQVLRPKGSLLDERDGIQVPALGVTNLADVMRRVGTPGAGGLNGGVNAAVTCDQPFYAMGSYAATNRWDTRVEFPATQIPTNLTTVTLDSRPGTFFRVKQGASDLTFPVNLDPTVNYHTMTIAFDVAVKDPPSFTVFRNVVGMFRHGGRRFNKTLFFGSFENFDKKKYVIDVGTPFIETTLKYLFPLVGGRTYRFNITLDNDQHSNHYVITDQSGAVVMDTLAGLYNDFETVNGNQVQIEMGLGGVADNAYFPPYGWAFQNLDITATK